MSWGCLSTTHRKTIPGGSTPASMRVTVLDRHPKLMPLVVNGTAVPLEELNWLAERVEFLQQLTEKLCKEKIENFG